MNSSEKIYSIVSKITKGKILTYKKVAQLAGINNPRLIGFYLHKNPDPKKIPCHRVIKSNGTLATGYVFGGINKQKEKLEKEGIKFKGKKMNLNKYLFSPEL